MYKNKHDRDKPFYIAISMSYLFIVYLAIAVAPYAEGGLPTILQNLDYIELSPLSLVWTIRTPKTIFFFVLLWSFIITLLLSYKRRYHRRGVEKGSADYASIRKMRKEFNSKSSERIVYTEKFAISVAKEDMYKHKRNYNTLIVGGPGSNKTRGYVYPNLLEASASYVVLDPKGEICRNTAKFLEKKHGYNIKVLNLINPNYSWQYNPFHYIRKDTATEWRADDDIQRIVTAIYKATTAPNSQTLDPFWDEAGKMLLSALMYLLYYFGDESEKNFPYLMNLIRAGRIEDEENDEESPLDLLFFAIERQYPDHIAVRYYKNATSGAGKTLQSVQITLLARLQKFELPSIQKMMCNDELELEKLATEPTVLYCIIPDNDVSYNFIVSLLYIQLFQVLYDQADGIFKGRLPRLVHVIMDEFANVHTPEDFLNILGGCRSRNIGISIILQNLSQLKTKYKEGWENIIGQCDEFMYLGGNEQSTHEYVSKMLGTETIDTTSSGRRYGMNGDSSTNFQFDGRELLKPDEVRIVPYDYAVLFVKNSLPLVDRKVRIEKYKKAKGTAIRGNKRMEYAIPLRSDRLKPKFVFKDNPSDVSEQTNIFDATAVGNPEETKLQFTINGRRVNISEANISELVESYYVSSEELENYLQNT